MRSCPNCGRSNNRKKRLAFSWKERHRDEITSVVGCLKILRYKSQVLSSASSLVSYPFYIILLNFPATRQKRHIMSSKTVWAHLPLCFQLDIETHNKTLSKMRSSNGSLLNISNVNLLKTLQESMRLSLTELIERDLKCCSVKPWIPITPFFKQS